jgi:hypothetical protein
MGKYLYVGIFNITGQMLSKPLHLLEIITNSEANIVGTNGLKAGVQVWQKKISITYVMDHDTTIKLSTSINSLIYHHLLLEELEGEVVFVFNELVFAPIVEVVVT